MLVEMAQERNRPLFPAMIYSTTAAYIATVQTASDEDSHNNSVSPADEPPHDQIALPPISQASQSTSAAPLLELGGALH